MDTDPLEYEFNQVKYRVQYDPVDFFVEHPKSKPIPEFLYKYYGLDKFSLDAILNKYLFASHPFHTNDKFDCYRGLVDFDINKNLLFKVVQKLGIFSMQEFEEQYTKNKWFIIDIIERGNQNELFSKYGFISLSQNPDSILMWSHYGGQNKGFMIRFKTEYLRKVQGFYGPFYLNYTKKFNRIPAEKKRQLLNFLYMSTLKYECWEYEQEWRILTFNPNGAYSPDEPNPNHDLRKFNYDPDSIDNIILGFDFFINTEVKWDVGHDEYCILDLSKNDFKKKLIEYISKNSLPCSLLGGERNDFQFTNQKVMFHEVRTDVYKMIISDYLNYI